MSQTVCPDHIWADPLPECAAMKALDLFDTADLNQHLTASGFTAGAWCFRGDHRL
jgi:hypothetical protein